MTTLEERRAWMRAGCPIESAPVEPVPKVELRGPCHSFFLQIEPDTNPGSSHSGPRLRVTCKGCGMSRHGDVILIAKLGSVHREHEDRIEAHRTRMSVESTCHWMVKHAVGAGMPAGEAERMFSTGVVDLETACGWVHAAIRDEPGQKWGGWLKSTGDSVCGIYLDPRPVE